MLGPVAESVRCSDGHRRLRSNISESCGLTLFGSYAGARAYTKIVFMIRFRVRVRIGLGLG